jgi:hypothetical protein
METRELQGQTMIAQPPRYQPPVDHWQDRYNQEADSLRQQADRRRAGDESLHHQEG